LNHTASSTMHLIAAALFCLTPAFATAAENPYTMPVGTHLVYETTATIGVESNDQKQNQSIAFRPEYTVLNENGAMRTVFCSLEAGNAETITTEPLSAAGRFTFELGADGQISERTAGFTPRQLPGWNPAVEFPAFIGSDATTASVSSTMGEPVDVNVTKSEAGGLVTYKLTKIDTKSTDTIADAAIKSYTATVVYSLADKQVKSHDSVLEAEIAQGPAGKTSFKLVVKSVAKERSVVPATELPALQKDILAGIKVMETLQQGGMQSGKLPEELEQYLKDNPKGKFAKIFSDLKESFEMQTTMAKNKANLAEGKAAPDFTAKTVKGDEVKLSSLKGQVVLLDFWASWCGPCLAELPELKNIYDKHNGKGLTIIGISADHDEETLVNFVKENDIKWMQIYDADRKPGSPGTIYGVMSFPTTVLIDAEGNISAMNLRAAELAEAIDKLLEKK